MNTKVPSLTGEQLREAYRLDQLERRKATLTKGRVLALAPITLLNLLPNDEGWENNLIPTAMLSEDLKSQIETRWSGGGNSRLRVYFNNGSTPIFNDLYPPDTVFPLPLLVPSGSFQSEGVYTLNYTVQNSGGLNDSEVSTFTVDTKDPNRNIAPAQMTFDTTVITPKYLEDNDGLPFALPVFTLARPGDTAKIYMRLIDSGVVHEVASIEKRPVQDFDPMVPMSGTIPKDIFVNSSGDPLFDDGTVEFYYHAYSRAGNETKTPITTVLSIAFKPMASGLQNAVIPLALENPPLIDRADAIVGVVVQINEFQNHLPKDEIEVTWGTRASKRFPVGVDPQFPLLSPPIPYQVLISEGDASGEGPKDVLVNYRLLRGLIEAKPAAAVSTSVDLRTPGPVNPDPGPENPELGTVVVYGGGADPKENSIGDEDVGQPVSVQLLAYPDMQAADVLEVVWNGARTGATYTVKGSETEFDIPMPFEIVTEHGDGPAIPVQIEISNPVLPPENRTITEVTPVAVDIFQIGTLTPVTFPDMNTDFESLGCCESIWEGAKVQIDGDPANFAEKDTVEVFWVGRDGSGDIPDSDGSETYTLTAEQATNGFEHVVAFDPFVMPIGAVEGQLVVWYKLTKPGGKNKDATEASIYISTIMPSGCVCIGPDACDVSACPPRMKKI
ncbi:MAG: hypothetical protein RSE94_00980 [Pseudomonas sp.]